MNEKSDIDFYYFPRIMYIYRFSMDSHFMQLAILGADFDLGCLSDFWRPYLHVNKKQLTYNIRHSGKIKLIYCFHL